MKNKSYHLLISDGGKELICIFETERNTQFKEHEKICLSFLYGDYIVEHIDYRSVDCYPRLDVIEDMNKFFNEMLYNFYHSPQFDKMLKDNKN